MFQVVFPRKLDKTSMAFDANAEMKRIGGPVRLESKQEATVEVYVDHSAVEVFLASGEALATRCVTTFAKWHCRSLASPTPYFQATACNMHPCISLHVMIDHSVGLKSPRHFSPFRIGNDR